MIFAIKPFEIHDGEGIRTTVFLKGCPLRCMWCHNPESLSFEREIMYSASECINCGKCTALCDANIIVEGRHVFMRDKCTLCGKCEKVCPREAFSVQGRDASVSEITERVLEDKMFLVGSGGGVTLSGGECLAQADFSRELLIAFKNAGLNTAVDTSGYATREAIDKILPYTDTFLYDIKAIDEEVHKKCTGRSNKTILENLRYIDSCSKAIEIRVPYVPGYNDKEMDKIADFVRTLKNVRAVKILPYHSYAEEKYIALGMESAPSIRAPREEEIRDASSKFLFLKDKRGDRNDREN